MSMQLLIVAHMPSPNMASLVQAVAGGAGDPAAGDMAVRVSPALETKPEDVLTADGLLLGTTENFGYMSGGLKDFFDRIYYPCLERTESLPYALFIRAGNDGRGARSGVERIVKGLGWKAVQPALICRGAWRPEFLDEGRELGMTVAAGLDAGIF